MAHLSGVLRHKYYDNNGDPLVGGKIYTYQAGTSTPLATYVDQTEATPNANPTILDANGEASIWLGSNAYKFVLTDSNDVVMWTSDVVSYLNDGAVTAAKIANDAVITAKILDSAVTTAKIASAAITSSKLASGVALANLSAGDITTTLIADNSISTAKLQSGSVTNAKLVAANKQLSSSSGSFSTGSSSYVDATNLTCTITTSGRPVIIQLVPDGSSASYIYNDSSSSGVSLDILRDVTEIAAYSLSSSRTPASGIVAYDAPAAGTYTYKVRAARDVLVAGNTYIMNSKLLVVEL